MEISIEALVEQAKEGDRSALESVIQQIQDRVYGLAIRMLCHPADAEDATQDILVRIITHLGTFRGESSFMTWVYRIASNYLLKTRKRRLEKMEVSFEEYGKNTDKALARWNSKSKTSLNPEQHLIDQDVMIECMQGMLLCLNRKSRIAVILGQIFEITSQEGGFILDITPIAFRKLLSRARKLLLHYTGERCGLINPKNPCRCAKIAVVTNGKAAIHPGKLLFAKHPSKEQKAPVTEDQLLELDELTRISVLFQNHPDYVAPKSLVNMIRELLDSGRFKLFRES
jgi:RNA polymerase sigma factor (sigma-70 family)